MKGLTLYKSVFDTIYHGGNFGQTSGEDGWTDYRYASPVLMTDIGGGCGWRMLVMGVDDVVTIAGNPGSKKLVTNNRAMTTTIYDLTPT